jgi:hypothetical protein
VQGLQGIFNGDTGAALAADQAQIQAAGSGFVADAADVSGNNIPIGGGTFVGTSTTVEGATSPAGVAQGTVPVAGVASGKTGIAIAQGGGSPPGTNGGHGLGGGRDDDSAAGGGHDTAGGDHHFSVVAQNHFELLWHHG